MHLLSLGPSVFLAHCTLCIPPAASGAPLYRCPSLATHACHARRGRWVRGCSWIAHGLWPHAARDPHVIAGASPCRRGQSMSGSTVWPCAGRPRRPTFSTRSHHHHLTNHAGRHDPPRLDGHDAPLVHRVGPRDRYVAASYLHVHNGNPADNVLSQWSTCPSRPLSSLLSAPRLSRATPGAGSGSSRS